MVCRITLSLRKTAYGPTTFERTQNSFPMSDLKSPRSGRSDHVLDSTATKNLEVQFRKDYDESNDYRLTGFTDSDVSRTAHQGGGQEVLVIGPPV
jgi:hypothetical protein